MALERSELNLPACSILSLRERSWEGDLRGGFFFFLLSVFIRLYLSLSLEGWINLSRYRLGSKFRVQNTSALYKYIFICVWLIRYVVYDLEGRNETTLRGREFGLVNYIYRFVC